MSSLRSRLLLAALVLLAVFVWLIYFALERSFVSSVTRAETEKLQSSLLLLLAEAESEQDGLWMPGELREARFNQIDSGLYAYIYDGEGKELWRSPSALTLPSLGDQARLSTSRVGESRFGTASLERESYLYSSMGISWEYASQQNREYTFVVLESAGHFLFELDRFRNSLLIQLAAITVLLLLVQGVVLHWGLRPLRQLATDLRRVERGEIEALEGNYPAELHPLSSNLNQLLQHERQQRESHKNRLSDLAHSLKTPLSIARGALGETSRNDAVIGEQLETMDQIVQYQLQRASSVSTPLSTRARKVAPALRRISDALAKVYAEKNVQVETELNENCLCYIDERDLMELLGNIIDNAYKYCSSRVNIQLHASENFSIVEIEDDGPGVEEGYRERIFTRGQRLDTKQSGQGIGLAVVMDIVESYGAKIELGDSALGGSRFTLALPSLPGR